jgi:hypothetical protein
VGSKVGDDEVAASYRSRVARAQDSLLERRNLGGDEFSKMSEGTYELCLPTKPSRRSGVIKIEECHKVMVKGPFTVLNYLEMKPVYRVSTKVAQLAV